MNNITAFHIYYQSIYCPSCLMHYVLCFTAINFIKDNTKIINMHYVYSFFIYFGPLGSFHVLATVNITADKSIYMSLKIFFIIFVFYLCMWVCIYVYWYLQRTEGALDAQELELQTAVSCLKWVLETELRSCKRAASVLSKMGGSSLLHYPLS